MALSDSQKTSFVYKKAVASVSETSTGRDFFEEPYTGRDIILPTQVWNQSDQIPNTAPVLADGATSGVVQYFSARSMTAVSGASNAYYLSDFVDSIPYNFGTGYSPTLTTSTGTSIPFGTNDWVVNNAAGTLIFYGGNPSGVSAAAPPKITFYKYVGTKGVGSAGGAQGVQGAQGPSGGAQGFQGVQGSQGIQGTVGAQGSQGVQGSQGSQGSQGIQGSQGHQGIDGAYAGIGYQGIQGAQGSQGRQGHQGIDGAYAAIGAQGIQGANGSEGYSTWTATLTNVTRTSGAVFTKTGGTENFPDAKIISNQSYDRSTFVSAKVSFGAVGKAAFGLTTYTPLNPDYNTMDYCIYYADGWIYVYENGSAITALGNAFGSARTAHIIYDGANVYYYVGTTLLRTTPRAIGAQGSQGNSSLFLNATINTLNQGFDYLLYGPMGSTGAQGYQGTQGRQGSQGAQGIQGSIGAQGHQGRQGAIGTIGYQGYQGYQGLTGSGSQGVQGAQGFQGPAGGAQGVQGSQGVQGATLTTIPQNYQSSSYTLSISDLGKHVALGSGTITVPASVFSIGDTVSIYNTTAGPTTIIQGSSVTLYLAGSSSTGNRTLDQKGVATVLCVGSNTFVIFGAGVS